MRLVGQIHVTLRGSIVNRDPNVWEKLKRSLGAQVNLETDRVRVELEATAIVDHARRALGRLGVRNALSLVIDETVIFADTDGKPDDLPDLVLALSEHASLFGRGFRELRFAAEHEETGLHLVIETRARTEHGQGEPSAIVSVGGRLQALEPRKGEDADAYRARVEPLTKETGAFEAARLAFESFVSRLQQALAAAMPEATVVQHRAEARLVRATQKDLARKSPESPQPLQPGYDPYQVYHPSPMGMMLDVMILSSFMHMMHPPHSFMVVNPAGAPVGSVADVAAQPNMEAAETTSDVSAGADDDRPGFGGDEESALENGGFDDGGGFDGGGFDGGGFDV